MKLLTKAILFVLFIILLFILTFKFVLFKKVVNSLISTGDEINFKLHRISVNIVNNILPNLSKVDKIKLLLTPEDVFTHHKHFIVDNKGNILKIKKDKIISIKNKIVPNIRNYIQQLNNTNFKHFFLKDKKLYLSIYKIKGIGFLCVLTPKKDIEDLVFKNLKYIIFRNILIIFFFFIIIGFFLIALIYKEINKLHEGILQIKKGNLDFKFKLKGSKEFVEIFQTINEITSNLQQTIKSLTEEKNRSEQYFEIAESIMLVLDKNANIAKINKKACEILGYKKDELIGKNWIENFIPESQREEVWKVFKEIIGSKIFEKKFKHYENKIIGKNEERLISWHNSAIRNEKGEIIGTLSSGFDITDIKKFEQEQLKISKLESLGLLAGGIAHDFNNLLTSISMNTELAKTYKNNIEKINICLIRIEKAIEKAKLLTNQLLTFSKGGEPIKKEHSIEEIIKETVDFVLSGSSIKVEFHFQKDLWHVNIDKGQISQVIQNIIINAKEAIKDFGIIKITCINYEFKEFNKKPPELEGDKFVLVKISDNGCGISEEFLNKIFDPYFTTKPTGNGLGLSICYSIIKKHKGHIEVESKIGKGTTFKIYLPAVKNGKNKKYLKSNNKETFQKKFNILILEDQQDIANTLKEILEHLGHNVILTDNSDNAIKLFKENNFDLCILDLTIPGSKGGFATGKEILKINPNAKIIVTSGYSTMDVMANYKKYGFKACLVKPFNLEDLKKILSSI